ncbi:MAG: hypothetical protein GY944_11005 [bacterium]|nr:hypothetical protein [bacterium]MCP5041544.1 hypothetical protein [bacterium]
MNDGAEGNARAASRTPATGRGRVRAALLVAIALLYIASVPWYRETGAPIGIVFGLPDWVAIALGCYIGVAILNAIAWRLTEVSDGEGSGE